MNTKKELTGYPSIDKPWLKYYKEGAEEAANNIPTDKTVWDVIEEKLVEYKDIPAIEYFGRVISRPEFIDMVYTWARAFKAMGVKEDEIVSFYGPFFPDICAMTFALNTIGACPYFLKLAISPEALAEETRESRIAVVFDDMWQNVAGEFMKERFEKIIIITAADGMSFGKKQVVSLMSKSKVTDLMKIDKFYSIKRAKKLADTYTGEIRAPFIPDRAAFITSSSGTTVDGVVKGCVATNESTISQLLMGKASDIQYFPSDRCLNHFPPTASTSLNVLFILALFSGETVLIDPRVSDNDFYIQLTTLKPNMALTTGSSWESFFNRVEAELNSGKSFDFSYAKGWTVGGEGTDSRKFKQWNNIMKQANSYNLLFSGYGSSELFSATSVEKVDARYDYSKQIMSVGIPYAGITMGVFDEYGKELKYNERGELYIKSKSAMKEYYNKPELTAQTKVDGWIRTGDLAEIDENGFVYIWGRVKDTVEDNNGNKLYLFDIANKIKEKEFIDDAIVLQRKTIENECSIVAHIVWSGNPSLSEQKTYIDELNECMKSYLPSSFSMLAYATHETMLPYSPTTLKKDKNKMSKQTEGFIQVIYDKLCNVQFVMKSDGVYEMTVERK